MLKQDLEKYQPKVYRLLRSALKNGRLAHFYLLAGPKDPLKLKTAYLLAQSIIEGNNEFACEECDTCRRIAENNYFDFYFIDGRTKKILVEDISKLYERFSSTALEKAGKRVYIIADIDNVSSEKVWTMLLKYIEEPNDDIYAIMTTDNIDGILPTIISRAQTIEFSAPLQEHISDIYKEQGLDSNDAYILSRIRSDIGTVDDSYNRALVVFDKTVDCLKDIDYLPIMYQREVYEPLKGDAMALDAFIKDYLRLFALYLSDSFDARGPLNIPEVFTSIDTAGLLELVLDILSKSDYNYDKRLLMDQLAYRIKKHIEGVQDGR